MKNRLHIKIKKTLAIALSMCAFSAIAYVSVISIPAARAATTNNQVSMSGLAGYWAFNEGTSTVARDSSGNSKNGTLVSSPTWVNGRIGKGLSFNGTNNSVTVASTVSGVKSVSFWVKPNSTTQKLIDLNGTASIELVSGTVTANSFTSPTIYVDGAVSSAISDTSWHYVTVTTGTGISASAIKFGVISSTFFGGIMDEVRMYSRALTAAEVRSLYIQGSVFVNASGVSFNNGSNLTTNLAGYWTLDGKDTPWTSLTTATALDRSGNGLTGTVTNMNQKTSPIQAKIGQGFLFDGSNDYVTMGDVVSQGGQFTVCAWAYTRSLGTLREVFTRSIDSGQFDQNWLLYMGSDNKWTFQVRSVNTDNPIKGSTAVVNAWTHLCGVYISGANVNLYVNGALSVNGGNGIAPSTATGGTTVIGAGNSGTNNWNGGIDEVRVYSRALSASEVNQLYLLGGDKLNAPAAQLVKGSTLSSSGLVGYWTLDGKDVPWTSTSAATALDKSGSGFTGTLTSMNQRTSPAPGKFGQALRFNGSTQYISLGSSALTSIDNVDKSISIWVNQTSSAKKGLVDKEFDGGGGSYGGWGFWIETTGKPIWWTMSGHDLNDNGSATITYGKWSMVSVVWHASAKTADFYINGVLNSTQTNNTIVEQASGSADLEIGDVRNHLSSGTFSFNGLLDDVRVYNRALSAAEIAVLYNAGR